MISSNMLGVHTAQGLTGVWCAVCYEETPTPYIREVFYGFGSTRDLALAELQYQFDKL
jgi:hypothetical protein